MHFLSDKQRKTLTAFCDTIHPPRQEDIPSAVGNRDPQNADPFTLSASELGISEYVERALSERDEKSRDEVRLLLNLLDQRLINGILAGHWGSFESLTLDQRTEVLRALAHSPFNSARAAFHAVKQLVSFLAYSVPKTTSGNPFWQAFDYQGRAHTAGQASDALPVMIINRPQTLTCDVLVVGSGAGGGVTAAELSAAGQTVIVAEKGNYFSNARLPGTEIEGMRRLYEGRGTLRTSDRGAIVLAGSTLGGGTTVNWMTCLDPPTQLREQWARDYGFSGALTPEYEQSVQWVRRRVHVTENESAANFQNDILQRGCDSLGYSVNVISRNVQGCVKCDFCSFGCRYGAKQDTRRTFLRDAVEREARIVVRADVRRILHQYGEVTGAEMEVLGSDGQTHRVEVKCKRVVISAGSIHTPSLMTRSGLQNRNIGANLFLHPTGAIFAMYDERVNSWEGAPQTRICDEFSDLDGDGYGFRIEASPAHPGLWAIGLPWQSGEQHRFLMQQLPHLANSIVLTRDKFPGRVETNANGQPVMHYQLHKYDAKHLMRGIEEALRIHHAAGAHTVYGPHNDCIGFDCRQGGNFESYLQSVYKLGTRPNHLGIFCAHQMSSCRLADSPQKGAVKPTGETYEVKNLHVADGSVLPTSSGVNPMITILATSHYLAQEIKSQL